MDEINQFKDKVRVVVDSPLELYKKAIEYGHLTMKDIRGLEHEVWKFLNKLNS